MPTFSFFAGAGEEERSLVKWIKLEMSENLKMSI
jgi:hypothetical protein